MVMERAVDNGESWETLIKEWADRDIYSRIDYRKIFRPEMKTTVQELSAAAIRSLWYLHRSEADLEDRGGGGHAPGI